MPCGAQFLDAVQLTLEQIDVIKRLAEMHPDSLRIATTVNGECTRSTRTQAYRREVLYDRAEARRQQLRGWRV